MDDPGVVGSFFSLSGALVEADVDAAAAAAASFFFFPQ
jgi:hypothetical protein